MKDMFGCQIFHNVEYLRRKKKNKVTMAMYIHIRGYKTRQNQKGHTGNMHSKARLKTLKTVRCWCMHVELYKNFCAK